MYARLLADPAFPEMLSVEDKAFLDQVERILGSNELRGAELLRRLLKYLADKSISGETDELKEYTIAIDGLGKPSSYDPKHNSAVRLQVARLRQKLTDYYCAEGLADPVFITVPKGSFRLTYEQRMLPDISPVVEPAVQPQAESVYEPVEEPLPQVNLKRKYFTKPSGLSFASLFLAVVLAAIVIAIHSWSERDTNVSASATWTPELQELWGPFIDPRRPVIVAIDDPLFARLLWGDGIYYRDRMVNDPKDLSGSAAVAALRHTLHDPDVEPNRYYTSFGEVNVSFMIGKLLGPRVHNFSLSKSSDLSWQQLADNNILFVGMQSRSFDQQMKAMPIEEQFLQVVDGVRNLHPRPGEPALFSDEYSKAAPKGGTAYALVTRLPGLQGNGDVESFASSHEAGYQAAVGAFVDPAFSRQIVEKLRQSSGGKMPRYFQILFKVKFRDETPIETTCVLVRQLP